MPKNNCKTVGFLFKLQAIRIIQSFPSILRKWLHILQRYSETCNFWNFQRQSVGGVLKVMLKSLETVFDEVHFTINLLYRNSVKKYED